MLEFVGEVNGLQLHPFIAGFRCGRMDWYDESDLLTAGNAFVIGDFTHEEDGSRWVMIVNKHLKYSVPCRPKFSVATERVEYVSPITGELKTFPPPWYCLPPGAEAGREEIIGCKWMRDVRDAGQGNGGPTNSGIEQGLRQNFLKGGVNPLCVLRKILVVLQVGEQGVVAADASGL